MKSTICRNARSGLLLVVVAILISACTQKGDNVRSASTPSYAVPFSVSFDRQGNPVIFNQKGEKIRPTEVDFPIKVEDVQGMSMIAATLVQGSCFYLLNFGGNVYKIDLPEEYCQQQ